MVLKDVVFSRAYDRNWWHKVHKDRLIANNWSYPKFNNGNQESSHWHFMIRYPAVLIFGTVIMLETPTTALYYWHFLPSLCQHLCDHTYVKHKSRKLANTGGVTYSTPEPNLPVLTARDGLTRLHAKITITCVMASLMFCQHLDLVVFYWS